MNNPSSLRNPRSKHSPHPRNEIHLIRPPGGGDVAVALVYPNEYAVGMSSLGYQTIYRILNSIPGVYCERAFTPAGTIEIPKTLESNRPISNFDIIAFSLSFEIDAIGVVNGLMSAGVPVESRKRRDKDPLVLIGGVSPTMNPEPVADFADAILIGEAEEALPELFARLSQFKGGTDKHSLSVATRTRLLAEIATVPGYYVPRFYRVEYGAGAKIKSRCVERDGVPETVERRWIRDLDRFPTHSAIIAPESEFGDMGLVEIARGCGRGCRFCAAGFIYRPPRFRPLDALRPSFELLLKHINRIGLVASSGTDHPQVHEIIDAILGLGGEVSFASLRLDNLSDKVLAAIARSSRTITIAPEAGTERLRKAAGKNISEYEILDAAERIGAVGIPAIKLYFLVGLPTETMDDVRAIVELTGRISDEYRKAKRTGRISVSIAPFVPKPFTPFGLHPMEKAETIEKRIAELRNLLRKLDGVEARFESVSDAVFQAALSRGDRRVSQIIRRAAEPEGSVRKSIKDSPTWLNDSLYAARNVDDSAPWDFIDSHVGLDYIFSEYHQGLLARDVNMCRPAKCRSCEACG